MVIYLFKGAQSMWKSDFCCKNASILKVSVWSIYAADFRLPLTVYLIYLL